MTTKHLDHLLKASVNFRGCPIHSYVSGLPPNNCRVFHNCPSRTLLPPRWSDPAFTQMELRTHPFLRFPVHVWLRWLRWLESDIPTDSTVFGNSHRGQLWEGVSRKPCLCNSVFCVLSSPCGNHRWKYGVSKSKDVCVPWMKGSNSWPPPWRAGIWWLWLSLFIGMFYGFWSCGCFQSMTYLFKHKRRLKVAWSVYLLSV